MFRTSHNCASGFVPLVLERCVLVNWTSEELRGAGLRVSNVFMARSAKANGLDASMAGGESMSSKGTVAIIFRKFPSVLLFVGEILTI